jgi:hypothetical protein
MFRKFKEVVLAAALALAASVVPAQASPMAVHTPQNNWRSHMSGLCTWSASLVAGLIMVGLAGCGQPSETQAAKNVLDSIDQQLKLDTDPEHRRSVLVTTACEAERGEARAPEDFQTLYKGLILRYNQYFNKASPNSNDSSLLVAEERKICPDVAGKLG